MTSWRSRELTLNKAVTLAVARETAKRSQEVLDTNQQQNAGISTYKMGLKKVDVQMGIIEKVPLTRPPSGATRWW